MESCTGPQTLAKMGLLWDTDFLKPEVWEPVLGKPLLDQGEIHTMDAVRFLAVAFVLVSGLAIGGERDRSPIAVAVSPDRSVCVTANHTGGSVSLIDVRSGRLLGELEVGRGPV